jgi:Fe-S-cluster containining protein
MRFKCKESCSDCCSIVPLLKRIVKKHESKAKGKVIQILEYDEDTIIPITSDMKCVFLDRENNRCVIYEDRPNVCMSYGVNKNMPCPYIKSNGNPRRAVDVKRTLRFIDKDVDFKLKKIKERCK